MIDILDFMIVRKETEVFGLKTSYLDYSPKDYKRTILLIGGGILDSRFFKEYIPSFPKDYRFIAPDLPGRGLSEFNRNDYSIDYLSRFVIEFIDNLKLQNLSVFAISYGTAVIIKSLPLNSERFDKIILLGAGEYLPFLLNRFIRLVCYPTTLNDRITNLYLDLISIFAPNSFKIERRNLSYLAKQYFSALDFKMDIKNIYKNEIFLLNFDNDLVVRNSSIIKLKKKFPNNHILELSFNHVTTKENTDKMIKEVFPLVIKTFNW